MEGIAVDSKPMTGGRLAELYREHAAGARRVAYLLTGDEQTAEDLVQDAFVRLAGRFLAFSSAAAAGSYIRRTVASLTVSRFRRIASEDRRDTRHAAMATTVHHDPDVTERDRMWRALQTLPERQRAAIVLRYYTDLSDDDIADTLRCRPGTVKSLLSRGMTSLRGAITDDR